jgi:hypothetical protein
MIEGRVIFAVSTIIMGLMGGCGPSAKTPLAAPSTTAAKADVTITFDRAHHTCVVALSTESQGSMIACNDVVEFVRDELRLPGGSTYLVQANSDVDVAEMSGVGARLKDAGYRTAQAR